MELIFSVRTDPHQNRQAPWQLAFFFFKRIYLFYLPGVIPTCLLSVCVHRGVKERFGNQLAQLLCGWKFTFSILNPLLIPALHTCTFKPSCSRISLDKFTHLPENPLRCGSHPFPTPRDALTSLFCWWSLSYSLWSCVTITFVVFFITFLTGCQEPEVNDACA